MTTAPVPETVGWVFGEPVTHEMLDSYLRLHPPPAAVGNGEVALSRWAARAVMAGVLARQEAGRRGLAGENELAAAVATELVGDGRPTEAEVRSYFEHNRPRYHQPERRRVRHVLCQEREEASTVAERARSGEPFSVLARECSADPGSRRAGGDLGLLKRGELAGEVEEMVFSAQVGQVVGPARSPLGWHVLVIDAIDEEREEDLSSVRDDIAAELAGRRRQEAYSAWLERRLLEGVTMAPGCEHPFQLSFLEWAHRH